MILASIKWYWSGRRVHFLAFNFQRPREIKSHPIPKIWLKTSVFKKHTESLKKKAFSKKKKLLETFVKYVLYGTWPLEQFCFLSPLWSKKDNLSYSKRLLFRGEIWKESKAVLSSFFPVKNEKRDMYYKTMPFTSLLYN